MPAVRKLAFVAAAGSAALLLAALFLTVHASSLAAPLAPDAVTAVEYASGLSSPVDIAHSGLLTDTRLFVVERHGRIKIVQSYGATGTVLPTPFLDIEAIVDAESYVEMGLLGLAFSPNYADDGQFYVYYNNMVGDLNLARYSVSADPNVADINGTIVLTIPHPTADNHNGGDLAFGPDGYLYLAPGDGGDTPQTAQDLDTLLGKVLRLDVTGELTYTVPLTNPFAATTGRDEIWAYGLRNPYRFSFDRLTGDLYIGDVGQSRREEINFQDASSSGGENYGWRCFEGTYDHGLPGCGSVSDYDMPVAEYCNEAQGNCDDGGRAVIAGHVYRGGENPGMQGIFFFADNASNRFWAMQPGTWQVAPLNIANVPNPSSFGEDSQGELYVVSLSNGRVYQLQGTVSFGWQTPSFLPFVSK